MSTTDHELHAIKKDHDTGALLFAGAVIAFAPVSVLPAGQAVALTAFGGAMLLTAAFLLGRTWRRYARITAKA